MQLPEGLSAETLAALSQHLQQGEQQRLEAVDLPTAEPMDDSSQRYTGTLDVATIDPIGHAGFLVHNSTGNVPKEGLGSHARGVLYPLLQVALHNDLIPIFDNVNLQGNISHNYDGLDFAKFLGEV